MARPASLNASRPFDRPFLLPHFSVLPLFVSVFCLAWAVFLIGSLWTVFAKAGQPGWAILIPIYNAYILLKIAERPVWWMLLYLVPVVNFVIGFIITLDLAKGFGKGLGYGLGLYFLGFIFFPILAFGDAVYVGRRAAD